MIASIGVPSLEGFSISVATLADEIFLPVTPLGIIVLFLTQK